MQRVPIEPAKQTRAGTVYDAIRSEILTGGVAPETKLKLAEYSQRYEVSLSVIREAMGRLAEQGLLQANPQRGFSTMPLSVSDLCQLTRARIVVETAALHDSIIQGDLSWEAGVVAAHHQLAATPMHHEDGTVNPEFACVHRAFHVALLAGSGNAHLESIATSLRDRSEVYLHWSRYLGHDVGRDVAGEHRELAELTVARKIDRAADALGRHIQRTTDSLAEYARSQQESAPLDPRRG